MRRATLLASLCACALASFAWACTQDFGIFDPPPDASFSDGSSGDANKDGASDAGGSSCTLSANCGDAAVSCGKSCVSGFNTCQTQCGANQPCKNQCAGQRTTCYSVCQSTCVSCAADASCASACQTAIGN